MLINGDFEEYFSCPITHTKRYSKYFIPGWESATTGTPDVYNKCSKTGAGVPHNWAGVSAAQSGSGYVGILVYGHYEFIKTFFSKPLKKNSKYIYSFYFKLSSYSTESIGRISTRFGGDVLDSYTVDYIKEKSLDRTTGSWELVSDTIIAKGGEKFLVIGNFDTDDLKTNATSLSFRKNLEAMLENHAYFYIDNVRMEEIESELRVSEPETLLEDQIYTFKNILFEFDKAILVDSTLLELNVLVDHLKKNQDLFLEVFGHTDESGDPEYNMDLSIRRAKSVVEFLVGHGINPSRMKYSGFGESQPILISEGEREVRNRRVEFVLNSR